MAKYYASSPEIGLVPLEGDALLEAIEDATGRSWKVSGRKTIPILNIDARPVAWIDPEDRTWTLTIDPDVEQLLLREMRRTNSGMKAVVNDALRAGLGIRGKKRAVPRYKVEPHAFGILPGIDPYRFNQLADELEATEFIRRQDN